MQAMKWNEAEYKRIPNITPNNSKWTLQGNRCWNMFLLPELGWEFPSPRLMIHRRRDRSFICYYIPFLKRKKYLKTSWVHSRIPFIHGSRILNFVWPGMNWYVRTWADTCIPFQRAKIHRHTESPIGKYWKLDPVAHLRIDLVGALQHFCTALLRFPKPRDGPKRFHQR